MDRSKEVAHGPVHEFGPRTWGPYFVDSLLNTIGGDIWRNLRKRAGGGGEGSHKFTNMIRQTDRRSETQMSALTQADGHGSRSSKLQIRMWKNNMSLLRI